MTMFVDPSIAKQFECTICLETYKEPVQIQCQDHIFCKQCVDTLLAVQGRSFQCPLCRTKSTAKSVSRVKFIDRQINDLKVKCLNSVINTKSIACAVGTHENEPTIRRSKRLKDKKNNTNNSNNYCGTKRARSISNEEKESENNHNKKRRKLNENEASEFCEWQGLYSELNNHKKTCPLGLVTCKYCETSMLQRELEFHYEICPTFPVQCFACCKTDICRNKLQLHIRRDCPMTLINCEKCQQIIMRKNKKLHTKHACPESLVQCPFYKFGCMEKLKRKNEIAHSENAAATHDHLLKIAKHQTKLAEKVNSLTIENRTLNAKIDRLDSKINAVSLKCTYISSKGHTGNPNKKYKLVYVDPEGTLYRYQNDANCMEPLGRASY